MEEQTVQMVICLLNKAIEYDQNLSFKDVHISFDLASTDAGQMVYDGEYKLKFNLDFIHEPDFLTITVPHEVAHLVVVKKWGAHEDPHGIKWHQVMKLFDANPCICHTFEYTYQCKCKTHHIPFHIHQAIAAGLRQFACNHCNTTITQTHISS